MSNGTEKDNIHELPVERRFLEYTDRLASYRINFDDRTITVEKERGPHQESVVHELYRLHPKLSLGKGQNEFGVKNLQSSLLLICAAIIIFFSDFNPMIPLLSPFLLILGIFQLIGAISGWNRGLYTKMYLDSGPLLTSIPHRSIEKSDREAFETTLLKAIQAERVRVYGSSETK